MSISSYQNKTLAYDDIFKLLTWNIRPRRILEFGILNGYSLKCFSEIATDAEIYAYDIFEKFNGNSAKRDIISEFESYKNVKINEGDFYEIHKSIPDKFFDIIHIDIANDGAVYEFAINTYMRKVTPGGIIVLEGGSVERDNVHWMLKYSKVPIRSIIEKYKTIYDIYTIQAFPSLTIIKNVNSHI